MSKLNEILSSTPSSLKALPLFHSCDCYALRSIAESSVLLRKECDVFVGEHLVYAFYGKPSYRIKRNNSVSSPAFFPVAFIFNVENLPRPYKVYPFDTGAFMKRTELREKYFHPQMQRDDFQLESDVKAARSLVDFFFSSNENYCDCNPSKLPAEIPSTQLEAFSYCSMINDKSVNEFDDRLTSIEFIFNDDILISKKTLLNIVLPKAFFDDPIIKETIRNKWEVSDPLLYYTIRGNPSEYHALVYNKAREYMEKQSLI